MPCFEIEDKIICIIGIGEIEYHEFCRYLQKYIAQCKILSILPTYLEIMFIFLKSPIEKLHPDFVEWFEKAKPEEKLDITLKGKWENIDVSSYLEPCIMRMYDYGNIQIWYSEYARHYEKFKEIGNNFNIFERKAKIWLYDVDRVVMRIARIYQDLITYDTTRRPRVAYTRLALITNEAWRQFIEKYRRALR